MYVWTLSYPTKTPKLPNANVPPRIIYRKVQSNNIIQNNDQPGIDSLSWIVAPAAAAAAVAAAAPRPAQQCPALDPTDPAARGTHGPPY